MVSNIPFESYLHDDTRIFDVIIISNIAVMELNCVLELVQLNVFVNLD